MDFIIKLDPTPTQPPDDILEAAKGQGIASVVVVGRMIDGTTWISASSSDAERLVFLLELAKRRIIDSLLTGVTVDLGSETVK